MTEEEKAKILGKPVTPELYYRLDDYKYLDTPKDRVLSGINDLDYCIKGFEMGCITIWTGFTNAGKTTVMTMLAKKTIDQRRKNIFLQWGADKRRLQKQSLFASSNRKRHSAKAI